MSVNTQALDLFLEGILKRPEPFDAVILRVPDSNTP
jgi:hypothetical protein